MKEKIKSFITYNTALHEFETTCELLQDNPSAPDTLLSTSIEQLDESFQVLMNETPIPALQNVVNLIRRARKKLVR